MHSNLSLDETLPSAKIYDLPKTWGLQSEGAYNAIGFIPYWTISNGTVKYMLLFMQQPAKIGVSCNKY